MRSMLTAALILAVTAEQPREDSTTLLQTKKSAQHQRITDREGDREDCASGNGKCQPATECAAGQVDSSEPCMPKMCSDAGAWQQRTIVCQPCQGDSLPAEAGKCCDVCVTTTMTTTQDPNCLGAAGTFAVLSKLGVTSTGKTDITGDVGTSPSPASEITGFELVPDASKRFSTSSLVSPGGKVYASDDNDPTSGTVANATLDMEAAFNDMASRGPADESELGSGNIDGMTLSPGIYKWNGSLEVPTSLVLSGGPEETWVMQISGNFNVGKGANVVLSGGAKPENIFWQVSGGIILGPGSHCEGVLLCLTTIVLKHGSSLKGACLAQERVVLHAATIVQTWVTTTITTTECAPGQVDSSKPCEPKTCSDQGEWMHVVIDCAPASDCTGDLLEPEAGQCCRVCAATTTTTTVGVCGGSGGGTSHPNWINLGTAGNFAILSKSGVTSTGTTYITGDVGSSPIAATGITGFGLVLDSSTQFSTSSLVAHGSRVYAADYVPQTAPMLTVAVLDMQAAFVETAGRVPADATELGAGNIAGKTLSPGIYKWGTNVDVAQSLTFSGTSEDVWIMQIAGNLVFATASKVVLSGGAKAENIFWQVSGYTRFGTYSHAEGVFLCMTKIVFQTGSSLNGAALAQTAVTLDAATIVKAGQNSCGTYLQKANIGTARNFAILSKSGITSTGTTSIRGDVGTSPIAATGITGFGLVLDSSSQFSTSSLVWGGNKVYAADYVPHTAPMLTVAILDMQAAFVDMAGRVPADETELGAGNIAGMTLSPGIYKWGTNVDVAQSLTFSGTSEDTWIMQIAGNLVFASASKVVLSGGAKAENIFWQVSGYTRFGTTCHAEGVFLCMTKIVFQTGSSLNGAALSQTAVTLDAATIVKV